MFKNINSNFLYLIISVIIFIYLYFSASYKYKKHFSTDHDGKKKVLIEINTNIIEVDTKNIYTHLMSIKENLDTVNALKISYNANTNSQLEYLIELVSKDLQKFKRRNNLDDIQLPNNDLTDIISDIKIILLILKQEPTGQLTLTNLHNLVKFLSKVTYGESYLSYDDMFDIDVKTNMNNQEEFHKYANFNKHMPKQHTDMSQNIIAGFGNEYDDGEEFVNDEINISFQTNTKPLRNEITQTYNTYNTQLFGVSDKQEMARSEIRHYVPFCNINKLKKESKKNNVFVDTYGKQSLRNDYGF